MSGGRNSFSINVAPLDALAGYMQALGDDAQEAARPAAKVMADVLYDEVKSNVAKIKQNTGNLAASIYRAFSKDNSPVPGVAAYHVSWRTGSNATINGRPVNKAGLPTAPHGHLIEHGYIQRYRVIITKKGEFKTAIRPEAAGKPKPKRRASQAEKDAYYQLRPGGPKQIPGKAFVRSAAAKSGEALDAGERYIIGRLLDGKK